MAKCVLRLKIVAYPDDRFTMQDVLLYRRNQLNRQVESWRPPLFKPIKTRSDHWLAASRRFLDLQAASIWRDLRVLLPQSSGLIVDVGCGAQPYRSLLNPKASYQGIDYVGARCHFGYDMPDTTYYEGDRWPLSDESVDLVLTTETLEHVSNPPIFLAEAFRCLKPGGRVLLTVPFAARWHFVPHDYWRFTPSGLRLLLSTAGFSDIQVFARGNALTVACYKVIAVFLPLLFPQRKGTVMSLMIRVLGSLMLPFVILLAAIANLSLRSQGGDDCLGYTAAAARPNGNDTER
jgi:SAM-dependent methyltransferase